MKKSKIKNSSCLILLSVGIAALCLPALASDEPDTSYQKEEKRKAAIELIRMQLKSEVLYASDVYFGDNTDVVYADRVIPSTAAPKEPEQAEETETRTTSSSSKKEPKPKSDSSSSSDTQAVSSPSSSGGTSGGGSTPSTSTGGGNTDPGGGTVVPPADPPPRIDPPIIDPPPACPT